MKTFILLFIACFFTYLLNAQPGTLDKTFGDTGIVIGSFPAANTCIAIQKDGKFIAAGGNGTSVLARYNIDGSIDSSFGEQGLVITNFPSGSSFFNSVAIQDDGKVLAAGQVYDFPYRHIALARYNTDGTLDVSFGTNGLVDYSIAKDTNVYVTDAAIQSDGKMLVTGLAYADNYDYGYKSFVVRFTNEGAPDESFGKNGEVFTAFTNPVEISSLNVSTDGNILIGGTYDYLTSSKFMLLRYLSNGLIDSSFGISGIAKEAGISSQLKTIAIQKDGSIIASGYFGLLDAHGYIKLIRFTDKGAIDSSFGENGVSLTQLAQDVEIDKLLIQNDGKIIGAGTLNPTLENAKFIVVRYLPGGDIDSLFGINGSTITASKSLLSCMDALLQNDGKILVAGETYTTDNNFAFARYLNDDKSQKQIIITKIKEWLQHHNGFTWNNNSNISSYAVQRSYDGIHWKAVSIERRAMSNSRVHYYEDPLPLSSTNYYRLQTTNTNGSVNYSNVIAVTASVDAIKISPNPAKNSLQIQGLSSNQNIKLTVVNFSGNVAISQQLTPVPPNAGVNGNTSYNLNITSLKPGNYLLKIEMGDDMVTRKFIKE